MSFDQLFSVRAFVSPGRHFGDLTNRCWARDTAAKETNYILGLMCENPATTDIGLCDEHYEGLTQ